MQTYNWVQIRLNEMTGDGMPLPMPRIRGKVFKTRGCDKQGRGINVLKFLR